MKKKKISSQITSYKIRKPFYSLESSYMVSLNLCLKVSPIIQYQITIIILRHDTEKRMLELKLDLILLALQSLVTKQCARYLISICFNFFSLQHCAYILKTIISINSYAKRYENRICSHEYQSIKLQKVDSAFYKVIHNPTYLINWYTRNILTGKK